MRTIAAVTAMSMLLALLIPSSLASAQNPNFRSGGFHRAGGGSGAHLAAGGVRPKFAGGAWGGAASPNRGGWQGRGAAGVSRGRGPSWVAASPWRGGGSGFNSGGWRFHNKSHYYRHANTRFNRGLLIVRGPAFGYSYPYYASDYGYPQGYGYGANLGYADDSYSGPTSGRSARAGQQGRHCTTSPTTCILSNPSELGGGCFCVVAGGRARGTVRP